MSAAVAPERMVAVLVPSFAVLAAGGDLDAAAATVGGGRIQVCTPAAREQGVRRGQRVRDAQRACPTLEVFTADPEREGRAFEPVILALKAVAAGVEVVRPGLCVLRATGPGGYYGGEQAAAGMLRDAVAEVDLGSGAGTGCGVGIADGVVAAVLHGPHVS